MTMKEKRFYILVVSFFCFIFLIINISALGVSPGKITMDFVPGYENVFEYTVKGVPGGSDVNISLEGPLSKYAELSENRLDGNGKFELELKLPNEIKIPGKNRIKVVVTEIPKKNDFQGSLIGTSIQIKAAIDINVPFPGQYLEITKFSAENVNKGEPVFFDLSFKNKGKEDLFVRSRIDIYSSENEFIETLDLGEGQVNKTQSKSLVKKLSTKDYNPGRYNATAFVDYGEKSANSSVGFGIGSLNIDIVNYTNEYIVGEGLKKFDLEIESGWNDKIDGAYADVVIFNSTKDVANFKTSTTSLEPWQKEKIEGYFDITGVRKGIYDAEATLHYFGKDTGNTKTENLQILFNETKENRMQRLVYIIGGVFVLALIVLIVLSVYLKKKKKS